MTKNKDKIEEEKVEDIVTEEVKEENETDKLLETIKELENKVLYNQAELINYRKRKDEEVMNMLKYANKDLILELIPILDNFERAMNIKQDDQEVKQYLTGIKLIYDGFVDTLNKFGVKEIDALGLKFDPNYHDAIVTVSDTEKEDDVIVEVLIKGYMLKDRVIRHSVVKVNKLEI
ncbi:MAG: nucleotide exchange factor GrpE [Bacilli bacterium]|nr:nucleotide exchange factor GrpE [Bacilli bacterium]